MRNPPPLSRRDFTLSLLALAAGNAAAQGTEWPAARPITWIVPFPPGGSNDVAARLLSDPLREQLKQSIVVDNRPGANGSLGAQAAMRSAADGYTWLVASDSVALWPVIRPDPGWDLLTNFTPVAVLAVQPIVFVTSPQTGIKSMQDVRTRALAAPNSVTFASSGQGSMQHLVGELAATELGIDLLHVPYKGGGQAVTDIISGQVAMGVLGAAAVMPHIRSGKLLALAQTTKLRSAMLPQAPTLIESGAKTIDIAQWSAVFVPRGTPDAIVQRMAAAIRASLADKALQDKLAGNSMEVSATDAPSFVRQLQQERVRWAQLIKTRNLQVQ